MKKPHILVCGDSMEDVYWWGEVDRISPEAPVPCVRVVREETRPGAAANVARNCEALGAVVTTCVIQVAKKIRVVARNQQVTRVDFDKKASTKQVEQLKKDFQHAVGEVDAVIFSDYGGGALDDIEHMITFARAKNKLIFIDPKGHSYSRYFGADLLKPNVHELREMMGGWSTPEQMNTKAQLLRTNAHAKALLLTQGSAGMTLYTNKHTFHVESSAREVFDVTGAGDTTIAAYAVATCLGLSLEDATTAANRAAGIVCGKFGTAVATKEEVFNGLD
jgi:D-glycero-beta-D-manno-heptose-7-phosphate kinase